MANKTILSYRVTNLGMEAFAWGIFELLQSSLCNKASLSQMALAGNPFLPCHIVTMAPLLSHTGLMTDGRTEEVSEAETLLADRPDLVFGILIFSASMPV